MSDYIKILLLAELAAGFTALFQWIRRESILHQLWHRAYDSLETAAARRVQDNRRSLQLLQGKKGFWQRMEQRLLYSGISRRFPFLTPELWILGNWRRAWRRIFWHCCWERPGSRPCWRQGAYGCWSPWR